jgi:hypothetical protein
MVDDTLGLSMIMLGAVFLVSAIMYILRPPDTEVAAFTATMSAIIEVFGSPAMCWVSLGLCFVGARLFVFGAQAGLKRDMLGFAITGIGLSILMGAYSTTLGGVLGNAIGGEASRMGTRLLGTILGLAALLLPAFVIWLRAAPPVLQAKAAALLGGDPAPATAESAIGGRAAPARKEPTEDPHGVTAAEADALLPDAGRDEILHALRTANRNSASAINHAPSPYPADVRREGGIPSGARPIETAHDARAATPLQPKAAALAPTQPAAAKPGVDQGRTGSVHTWSAAKPVAGPVGIGADLAGAPAARGPVDAARAQAAAAELKAGKAAATTTPLPPNPAGLRADSGAKVIPIPASSGPISSPTWESEVPEFIEEPDEPVAEGEAPAEAADEPRDAELVDAYGTPLELVAALREDAPAERALADEPEEEELGAQVEAAFEQEIEAHEHADERDEELEAATPISAAWEDVDEASTADEVEVDEPQVEELFEAQGEAAVDIDAESEAELSEAAPEPVVDTTPDPEREPGKRKQPRRAGDSPAKAEREVVLQPVQSGLFDAEAQEPEAPEPAVAPKAKAKAPRERTVVLDPKPAAVQPEGDELVRKSGLLILERGRVAVSMLVREYGLDFKQATAVLDELQSQGLIGPYLGGQSRDILLTAEEWRAKTGALS